MGWNWKEEVIDVVVQQTLPPPAPAPRPLPPAGVSDRHPPSRLGRAVISVAAVALGVLGLVDLAGAAVPGSFYIALALAVVGVGLVAGAWVGRARWLIAVGAVLTVLLGLASLAERIEPSGSATWRPTGIEQVQSSYRINFGNAVLDLSAVDFTGQSAAVVVEVGTGDLRVVVPPTVDVRAEAQVDIGNAQVFGTTWNGIGEDAHVVTDNGGDGPGGGRLELRATVNVGNLEVRR